MTCRLFSIFTSVTQWNVAIMCSTVTTLPQCNAMNRIKISFTHWPISLPLPLQLIWFVIYRASIRDTHSRCFFFAEWCKHQKTSELNFSPSHSDACKWRVWLQNLYKRTLFWIRNDWRTMIRIRQTKVLWAIVGIEINYVSFPFVGQYSLVEPDGSIRTVGEYNVKIVLFMSLLKFA